MKKTSAFTLVELVVGITISLLLMTSVWIFVSSGMQNILNQQKVLKNTGDFSVFVRNLYSHFEPASTPDFNPQITSSWVIFRRWLYFWDGWLSYIWTTPTPIIGDDGIYCLSGSEDTNTDHIFTKSFIPYEEIWEDIFSNFDNTLSSQVVWTDTYRSDYQNHTITKNGDIIIWKWVFGDDFTHGETGTGISLNSPTWLTLIWTTLFISDTLNNRILYYNTSSNHAFKLLDEKDGISEPTGLYYDSWVLYIANSWKWEILSYSSITESKELDINFELSKNINNLKKIEIEFFNWITNITNPISNATDKAQFNFAGINKQMDYLTGNLNKIEYYFSNFWNGFETLTNQWCSTNYTSYYESGWDIIREQISNCNSSTGTIQRYRGNNFDDLLFGNTISIRTNSDVTGADFTATWTYYTKLSLHWDTDIHEGYYPFFTESDADIRTPWDNTLKTITWWLIYPTGIQLVGWQLRVNEFGTRKQKTIDLDGTLVSSIDLTWFNDLIYNPNSDAILNTPIESLNTNYSNNLLTLILKYYKKYNCYDLNEKIERTFILRKDFE